MINAPALFFKFKWLSVRAIFLLWKARVLVFFPWFRRCGRTFQALCSTVLNCTPVEFMLQKHIPEVKFSSIFLKSNSLHNRHHKKKHDISSLLVFCALPCRSILSFCLSLFMLRNQQDRHHRVWILSLTVRVLLTNRAQLLCETGYNLIVECLLSKGEDILQMTWWGEACLLVLEYLVLVKREFLV